MMRLIILLFLLPSLLPAQIGMFLASETIAGEPTYPGDTVAHNLVYWGWAEDVDGDGNNGNNSGDYQTWADLSGNGNDVAQTGTFNKATYTASHLNGYAALHFDGNDCFTSGALSMLDNTEEYIIFVVGESTGTTSTDGVFQLKSSTNDPALYGYVSQFVHSLNLHGRTSTGGNKYASQNITSTNDPFFGAFIWDDQDEIYVYANTTTTEGTHVTGVNSTITTHSDFTVGAQTNTCSNGFIGYMHEMIVYKGTKSEAVTEHILTWLKTRYNL